MTASVMTAVETFSRALDAMELEGCHDEIEWQRNRSVDGLTEQEFLSETAWVILNSGFKEAVVRTKFDYISLCFLDWVSAGEIVRSKEYCVASALSAFGNVRKMKAIANVAEIVEDLSFPSLKKSFQSNPIQELRKLPHIGPVTVWHLAKNLGFDVAKPDRHLVRLALSHGYDCVHSFCATIAESTGEKVAVVDLVLWRYLVSSAGWSIEESPASL